MNDEDESVPWEPFNETRSSQFSSICVSEYRGVARVSLHDLRRINLIVGLNEVGKTSVLEAIHLLSHQNDKTALLDVMRWRGRWEGPPDPDWLAAEIPEHIHISGHFDQVEKNFAKVIIQRTDDMKGLVIESHYGDSYQSTDVTLFSDCPIEALSLGRRWLCPCSLTNPFGANRTDVSKKVIRALEGINAKVIDFIDANIARRMSNAGSRHHILEQVLDPSSGDGLRRVFEIGLLLASVRGGVLLIDEFESSLHPQLLRDFIRIVQQLATEHNVQVFLTTHSKEALDAFISNNQRPDDIAAYALRHRPQGVDVRRFDGKQLLLLHEAADFDLRGVV